MHAYGWVGCMDLADLLHPAKGKLCVEWGSTNTTGTSMFMMMKISTHIKCEVNTWDTGMGHL